MRRTAIVELLSCLALAVLLAEEPHALEGSSQPSQKPLPKPEREMVVTQGKFLVLDSPTTIRRVAVANADTAEAVAVSPNEVLVNGKAPGETSLIVWLEHGERLIFDLHVQRSTSKVEAVEKLIREELRRKDP